MNNLILSYTIILLLFLIFFIMNKKETFDAVSVPAIQYSLDDATIFLKKCIKGKKGVKGEPGEDRRIDVQPHKLYTDFFNKLFESKEKTINYNPNNCLRDHGSQEVASGGSGGRGTDHMCPPNATICNIEPGNSKGKCSNLKINYSTQTITDNDRVDEDETEPINTGTITSNQPNNDCRFNYNETQGKDIEGNTIYKYNYEDSPKSCTIDKPHCRGYKSGVSEEFGECISNDHMYNLMQNGCTAHYRGIPAERDEIDLVEDINSHCPKNLPYCYKKTGQRGDCTTQDQIDNRTQSKCIQDFDSQIYQQNDITSISDKCISELTGKCEIITGACMTDEQHQYRNGNNSCRDNYQPNGDPAQKQCPSYIPKCYAPHNNQNTKIGLPGNCITEEKKIILESTNGCSGSYDSNNNNITDGTCPLSIPHCLHGSCVHESRNDMLSEVKDSGIGKCGHDWTEEQVGLDLIPGRPPRWVGQDEQRLQCPKQFPFCRGYSRGNWGTCVNRDDM